MDNLDKISFKIQGLFNGEEISINNVPISLLTSFSGDISKLIKSIGEREKDEDIIVSIEKGSINIIPILSKPESVILNSEFDNLFRTNDLSYVSEKRIPVYDNWSKIVSKHPDIKISMGPSTSIHKHTFDFKTKFTRISDSVYVDVELYLYGEVLDMGGVTKSNIHLKSDEGDTFLITCLKEDLRNDEVNRIYKKTGARVNAKYNIKTDEYKEYKLIEFVDYNPVFDESNLNNTIEKGREAWKDVDDHIKWLRELRGYE